MKTIAMKYKKVLFLIVIAFLSLFLGTSVAKPLIPGDGAAGLIIACLEPCDRDIGPVCGIDASGMTRTFENECFVQMAYCNEGRYYAVISDGEC